MQTYDGASFAVLQQRLENVFVPGEPVSRFAVINTQDDPFVRDRGTAHVRRVAVIVSPHPYRCTPSPGATLDRLVHLYDGASHVVATLGTDRVGGDSSAALGAVADLTLLHVIVAASFTCSAVGVFSFWDSHRRGSM